MRIAKAAAAGLVLLFAGGCSLSGTYPVFAPDANVPDPAVLKDAGDSADCSEADGEDSGSVPWGAVELPCGRLSSSEALDIAGDHPGDVHVFLMDTEQYGAIDDVAYENYLPQTPVNDGWEEQPALRIGPRDALQTCDGFSTCVTLVQFEAYSMTVEVGTAEDAEYSEADLLAVSEEIATALTEEWDAA